jgi:competence ComEA-like helix-hairpin-helix protein
VAHREEEGGYLRPEDLLLVRGIGPSTLEKIRSHLDFSAGIPLELRPRAPAGAREADKAKTPLPLTDPRAGGGDGGSRPLGVVNVNSASSAQLQTLPGIGPALAERILRSRSREGPFRVPEDLLRVPGIGPAILARIRDRISTGG